MRSWPICLPCFRQNVSMNDDPPHDPGWPGANWVLCDRWTNHGITLTDDDLRHVLAEKTA